MCVKDHKEFIPKGPLIRSQSLTKEELIAKKLDMTLVNIPTYNNTL